MHETCATPPAVGECWHAKGEYATEPDRLVATASALACYGLAAEFASERAAGPGSFKSELFDALFNLTPERLAESLGGVESLIEQPLVMSYYECTPEERLRFGIPDNMIRLSCGIENADDLIADLAQALES